MNIAHVQRDARTNLPYYDERVDLACAFRWTARLNMHEAVANHFSLAVDDAGTRFLMNPNQVHFSRIKASDLLLIDANDPETLSRPDAPDPTAWGLHGFVFSWECSGATILLPKKCARRMMRSCKPCVTFPTEIG